MLAHSYSKPYMAQAQYIAIAIAIYAMSGSDYVCNQEQLAMDRRIIKAASLRERYCDSGITAGSAWRPCQRLRGAPSSWWGT